MKRRIRRGVFETNSSSVHSLTMCSESEYDRWIAGELLLYVGHGYGYPASFIKEERSFYTKEEAITLIKASKYSPTEDFDWEDEAAVMEMLHDNEWYDSDYWDKYYLEDYESFEDSYTTPSGEKVVAFGYYGDNY